MVGRAIVVSLLAAVLAGAAQGQAPAPAPSPAANNTVSGVFILTAGKAVFANATTLELSELANTTEYVTFPPKSRAGTLTQAQLASPSFGAGSAWAGEPQAALSGIYNGQQKNVLLQLESPVYSEATAELMFQYTVLAPNATALPASGGTVNAYAGQTSAAEGDAAATLPYVTPGSTTFYNASLSIDVVDINRYLLGAQRAGLIRIDLGGGNCCFGPGWRG